jgi:homoserine/homoserine lactone efflux protein
VSLETWLFFCATETVLCLTPGPAVLLVVSIALTRGLAPGVRASLGILAANASYFAISASGLGAALLASWELFAAIKWAGAAYLVWLGLRMLAAALRRRLETAPAQAAAQARFGAFANGFVTQGASPKSLLFFTAILPQFIDPRRAVAEQVLILGVSSVMIELAVLCGYALVCARARGVVRAPRFAAPLQALGGALLVSAGVRLAALRRN